VNAGKKVEEIDHVPAYWPDTELVRKDMLDYATEVEAFDAQVGSLIDVLNKSNLQDNTLVIVTSDHGMPFPRVKGHTFDNAHHVPFIASWPKGIIAPGRRITNLLSFIDFAPTVLELMDVDGAEQGMSPITGASFANLIKNDLRQQREFVIIGRERNDVLCRPGTPAGLGYPARAIRSENYLFIHNFKEDRWPCGDPAIGFKDTDASPTKAFIEELGEKSPYWQHAFGKRPADQLFDVLKDPDCVKNLATDPAYRNKAQQLKDKLLTELKSQGDPRALGQGDIFDEYLSPRALPTSNKKKDAKAPIKQ
jgi:arylsulfatase A-like enzyme